MQHIYTHYQVVFGRNKPCIPITYKNLWGCYQSATRFRHIQGLALCQHLTELSHCSFTWMFQRVLDSTHTYTRIHTQHMGRGTVAHIMAGLSSTLWAVAARAKEHKQNENTQTNGK